MRYLAKIPTMALCVMAGFIADKGHYNPRTMVEPPKELLQMIWPWIELELKKLGESEADHVTAKATLRFWQYLQKVLVQDAAATLLDYGDQKVHVLFRQDLFRSEEFKVSFYVFYF